MLYTYFHFLSFPYFYFVLSGGHQDGGYLGWRGGRHYDGRLCCADSIEGFPPLFIALHSSKNCVNFPSSSFKGELGCLRNSADTEFRMFFVLPCIPYSIRNCTKFRGIIRIPCHGIRQNSAEFSDFWCVEIFINLTSRGPFY